MPDTPNPNPSRPETDFDIDEFLQRPLFAHLATTSPDGAKESPVWYLWEDGYIWLIGNSCDSFPKRLQQDSYCAIGIVDFNLQAGFLQYVGIRGTATVLPLDQARFHRLLSRYIGDNPTKWNPYFKQSVIDKLDLMVQITPISIVARDQSYFGNDYIKPA